MLRLDYGSTLKQIERRDNLVKFIYRSIGAGFALMGVYNAGYSLYMHVKQKDFIARTQIVLEHTQTALDSLQSEQAVFAEQTQRLDETINNIRSDTRLIRRRVSVVEQAQKTLQTSIERHDTVPSRYQAGNKWCGDTRTIERGLYVATIHDCVLDVEISRGGTIAGASLAYFNDAYRWVQDWAKNKDFIERPDKVLPGALYVFYLTEAENASNK